MNVQDGSINRNKVLKALYVRDPIRENAHMLEDLFKQMNKDKERGTNFLKESLNADKSFFTSRDYLEKRLAGVDEVIRNNSHELYYNRKFHLQNLYEDKEKID